MKNLEILRRYRTLDISQKNIIITGLIFFAMTCYVTLYEYSISPDEIKNHLITIKLTTVFFSTISFFFLFNDPQSRKLNFLLDIFLTLYCFSGSLYSKGYEFALFNIYVAKIFLLKQSFNDYIKSILVSFIIVLSGPSLSHYFYNKNFVRELNSNDFYSIYFTSLVLYLLMKYYFEKNIEEIDTQKTRMATIGKNYNIFAHNIKSMFSSQFMLTQAIKNKLNRDQDISEDLDESVNHLNRIHNYLNEMNKIETEQKTTVQISNIFEIIELSLGLLNIKKDTIKIEDKKLLLSERSRSELLTIFINIFSNAKKSISQLGSINNLALSIKDNHVMIRYLYSSEYITTSNLGMKLIEDLCNNNKIKFKFDIKDKEVFYHLYF